MKAWYVYERGADAGEIHWADTPGKAKMSACKRGEWINDDCDWRDIHAERAPKFDGEPRVLTCHDWIAAGYGWQGCEMCLKECEHPCL